MATSDLAVPGWRHPDLTSRLVAVMAVATGMIVANLYYAQPLLHVVAVQFRVGSAGASSVITVSQIGYAAGLILVVPLGDLIARRHLVTVLFVLAGLSLILCAAAPNLELFELGAGAAGCLSVGGQVMIPFAADMADPERRGRVVARIMSGLLSGILLARTVSGLVAQAAGWRAVYWMSAALMGVCALILSRALPRERRRDHVPYRQLVVGSFRLLRSLPALRRRAWHGACVFAAFSVLWTSLAFLLSGSPYHYSNAVIGLFGLAGVAGVGAANVAGKMADAQRTTLATAVAGGLVALSFLSIALGKTSLVWLLVGIVVLDLGTQGMQITNQAVIYALAPEARSRINSAYMFCYFVGGSVGSISAGFVYARWHWDGIALLGAFYGALTLLMALVDALWPVRERSAGLTPPVPQGDAPSQDG